MDGEATNGRGPAKFEPPKWRERKKLDLVGSAEAAQLLGVEKPRIGRFISRGIMPPQAVDCADPIFEHGDPRFPEGRLAAGPVWYRTDVVRLADAREKAGLRRSRPAPAA